MLTSVGRYSFQAHHFQLAHDITLDNADSPLDDAEKNFPVFEPLNVKENETPTSAISQWTTTNRSGTSACLPQQQQQQQRTTVDLLGDKLRNASSSTCQVGFNSLLEARNQRNAAKSKFDTSEDLSCIGKTAADVGQGGVTSRSPESNKKLKPDVTSSLNGNGALAEGIRGWRIEDFATTERQCTKSGLNSFITGLGTKRSDDSSVVCRAEDRKSSAMTSSPSKSARLEDVRIPARFVQSSYRSNQPVQSAIVAAIAASNAADCDVGMTSVDMCRPSAPLPSAVTAPSAAPPTRVARQLPQLPAIPQKDAANRCGTQTKVERRPSSPKQVRAATMSLAEELQAALRAASSESSSVGTGCADRRKVLTLPLGVYLENDDDSQNCRGCEVGISQFLIHVSELGTPDQVDPVNKYRDVVCDMAYGCVYHADSGDELETTGKNEEIDVEDRYLLPSTISESSSTSSGLMLSSIEDRMETNDVIAMTMTHLPPPLTQPLQKRQRRLDADDDHVVPTTVTSRVVECLPDVIAATVGASSSRTDKDRGRHRDDDLDDDLGCFDFITGSPQGNKKSSALGSCADRTTSLESSRSSSPARRSIHSSSSFSSCSLEYDLDELDATHRGCHRFVPRHPEELAIEISDPIYVEVEEDDLWCEGINLRTKQRGIFPTAYATDLSILDDVPRSRKFFLKFLGSIEVGHHKGNDVLMQAINKLVMMRQAAWSTNPPPLCCIEINEYGIKMTERTKKKDSILTSEESTLAKKLARLLAKSIDTSSNIDTFFSLKNICFCGYHPKNERYLGIITKHPLAMRFACHIFLGEKSTRTVAEVIGDSFQRFYQEYLAVLNPTEDIYLE